MRKCGVYEIIGGVDINDKAFSVAEKEESKPLKRYESIEKLVADPQIEVIFIATPAGLHVQQAMIAARAGKAVFCEKPMGSHLKECRQLVEYCEKYNIPHGHGFDSRFSPIWQEVKKIVDSGVLGRIVSVSATTMHTGGLVFEASNWRFKAGENPGGPLFQCGIHKIDNLRFLFGEGQWISGIVNRNITPSPTEDAYVLLGSFGDIPVTFHSHYVACYRHSMEIYGTKGDLFITEFPDKLEQKITNLTSGFEPVCNLTRQIPKSDAEEDSLCEFAQAIRERRQPLMNGREGLNSLELVFQAAKIAESLDA